MPTQKFTKQDVDQLSAWLQRRDEAQFAWRASISQMIQTPGNRGLWLGGFDSGGDATDLSELGHHLGYNGNPTYNVAGLVPYLDFDGTGDYLWTADHADHDILGNEAFVAGATQGLMIGGWFYFDRLATAETPIGKWGAALQRAYRIRKYITDEVRLEITNDGTAIITSGAIDVTTATWYHIWGLFSPNTADNILSIYVNGVPSTAVAGVASIFGSNAGFEISGANVGVTQLLDGRASACGLYAMASGTFITAMYHQQRAAYGV